MIDKTKIIDTVCERLEKLPLGHYIDLKTYKRNRTVIIVKRVLTGQLRIPADPKRKDSIAGSRGNGISSTCRQTDNKKINERKFCP